MEQEQYSIKSIRVLALRFTVVKDLGTMFEMFEGDEKVGIVYKNSLDAKTRSKLTSLSE